MKPNYELPNFEKIWNWKLIVKHRVLYRKCNYAPMKRKIFLTLRSQPFEKSTILVYSCDDGFLFSTLTRPSFILAADKWFNWNWRLWFPKMADFNLIIIIQSSGRLKIRNIPAVWLTYHWQRRLYKWVKLNSYYFLHNMKITGLILGTAVHAVSQRFF